MNDRRQAEPSSSFMQWQLDDGKLHLLTDPAMTTYQVYQKALIFHTKTLYN